MHNSLSNVDICYLITIIIILHDNYNHTIYTQLHMYGSLQRKLCKTIARVLRSFATHTLANTWSWAYYLGTLDGVIFQHLGVLFICKAVALCTHCYPLLGIHSHLVFHNNIIRTCHLKALVTGCSCLLDAPYMLWAPGCDDV